MCSDRVGRGCCPRSPARAAGRKIRTQRASDISFLNNMFILFSFLLYSIAGPVSPLFCETQLFFLQNCDTFAGSQVSFASVDDEFPALAFGIGNDQGTSIRSNNLNCQLVILSVVNQMRGREANAVLATKKCSNTFEDVGDLRLEARKPCRSSGQVRERLELVLCLKIAGCSYRVQMLTFRKADRKYGHVALLDPFEGIVQCSGAHGVGPRRNQKDRLLSLHTVEAIERVDDGVVHIGLTELGIGQAGECLLHLGFVPGKVVLDRRLNVVSHKRYPIERVEVVEKVRSPRSSL